MIVILLIFSVSLAFLFWQFGFDWSRYFKKRPNVILIVVDALRPDHLSSNAYSRPTSPFIDWLSRQGVSFENTISQSTWTKTSIPSLLASIYPEAHGVRGVRDVLPNEVILISEVLKDRGYQTCCVQSNAWLKKKFGFDQGYDKFIYDFLQDAAKINARTLEWLDAEEKRPFFLYLHYMDVHNPYIPPAKFDIFGPDRVDKYDGTILHIDTRIKQLFYELEKRGLAKNTWIVITADHGDEFEEHGGIAHSRTLYNEVLKVPLVFFHSGLMKKAKIVKRQVRLIDVAPTLLDLARIPKPESMEGISLKRDVIWPFDFQRRDMESYSQVGLNDWAPHKDLIAYTTPISKYIYDFRKHTEELYSLRTDPKEQINLAASRPDLTKTFREIVTRFREVQRKKRKAIIEKAEIDDELREQLKSLGYLR